MKCKTWCVDVQSNNVAEVYAEQIKDRVLRFGYEHPASAVSFQSFFDFVGHHQLLNPFKSKDHQSIMLMWTWSIPVQLKQHAEDFVVQLREFIQSIDEFGGEGAMEVKLTGNIILDHEMKAIWPRRLLNMCLLRLFLVLLGVFVELHMLPQLQVSILDFVLHEIKTVGLPILILGYVLRSARLLLLALTPMLFEIIVGFGFMYFVSCAGMTISYYALMIMLMLIMALSWDYALFMLTRYKTEREAGASVEEAVIQMVATSGSIVVVSGKQRCYVSSNCKFAPGEWKYMSCTGVVLSICWSVMLGLPDMFKTFGIAAASAIMVCAGCSEPCSVFCVCFQMLNILRALLWGVRRLRLEVLAQLTFVAPVLAILPWLGPDAGVPTEVEPLSPTGPGMLLGSTSMGA